MSDKSKKNNKRTHSHADKSDDKDKDKDAQTSKRARPQIKAKHEHKEPVKQIVKSVETKAKAKAVQSIGSNSSEKESFDITMTTEVASTITSTGTTWLEKSENSDLSSLRESQRPFGIPKLWIIAETCPADKFEKLACTICHHLAWKPKCYSSCEHFACASCHDENYKITKKTHCSFCGDKVLPNVLVDISPFIRREFASIRIKCPGYSEFEFANFCTVNQSFCDKEMAFFDGEEHLKTCPFESVECLYCKEQVSRKDMVQHVAKFCMKRTQECKECKMTVSAGQVDVHNKYKCVVSKTASIICVVCKSSFGKGQFLKHVQDNVLTHAHFLVGELESVVSETRDKRKEAHSWIGKRVSSSALFRPSLYGTVTGIGEVASANLNAATYYAFVVWDDSDYLIHPLIPETALKLCPTGPSTSSFIDLKMPLAFPGAKDSKWRFKEETKDDGLFDTDIGEMSLTDLFGSLAGAARSTYPPPSWLPNARFLNILPLGPMAHNYTIAPVSLPMPNASRATSTSNPNPTNPRSSTTRSSRTY